MEKIVVLSEVFPPQHGGSGRWFWELYSRITQHEIHVYTHIQPDAKDSDGVFPSTVVRGHLQSSEWGVISRVGLRFYGGRIKALYHYCKAHHITQIHSGRVLHEGLIGMIVAKLLGIRHLVFVHGEDIETTAVSREHDFLARQVFRYSHQAICNSHNSQRVMQRLGYVCRTIDVIHPGADAGKFVPASPDQQTREALGWQDKFVILTVGRLQARKGQDKMIEALVELKQHIPNVLYVIVGNGDTKAQLQSLTEELDLSAHVQFKSELDDAQMLQCYQQCDLFILPNRSINNDIEGFGMVLVEAQLCSKVVLAGDSGGTCEALSQDHSGLIVDCTEPSTIARAIAELYQQPDRLAKLAEQARPFAKTSFDWAGHVKTFCQRVGL